MNSFLRKFLIGEWNLGICNQNFIEEFARVPQGGTLKLQTTWMKHHHYNFFYADPFIYKVAKDRVQILAEEYFFTRSKGVISLLDIDRNNGKLLGKQVVLEETCHLSYPFYDEVSRTFTPESFRNGNWVTYDFDGKQVCNKRIIADFPLIDATPVEYNGKWYVFATNHPHALDELLIYQSDHREGPFTPHPGNPVKKCIKTSRPGGKCFVHNGNLYRVVQDSTSRYGETMHIMKVTELSPTTFSEELFCHLEIENPGKFPLGFHTLNFTDDFIVIDGFREQMRPFFVTYIVKIRPILKKIFKLK